MNSTRAIIVFVLLGLVSCSDPVEKRAVKVQAMVYLKLLSKGIDSAGVWPDRDPSRRDDKVSILDAGMMATLCGENENGITYLTADVVNFAEAEPVYLLEDGDGDGEIRFQKNIVSVRSHRALLTPGTNDDDEFIIFTIPDPKK